MTDPDAERLEEAARQVIVEHWVREATRMVEEAAHGDTFDLPPKEHPGWGPLPERVEVTYMLNVHNEEADPAPKG